LESSKVVLGVFDVLEMLGSLYEHLASVVTLVFQSFAGWGCPQYQPMFLS
jgi:hypothetical protein